MPIFDYKCRSCEHVEEFIVKDYMQQVPCPKCGNTLMQRQVAAPTFRIFGEGVYKPNKK
jgi:putative FmdB family regulatory protein